MSRACWTGLFLATLGSAAVTRVEIAERTPIPSAGYERLFGKVHFAVDPKLAANQRIADIEHAPRNAQGLVEFSADLLVYRPVDPAKANGTALVDIPNRGGITVIASMQVGAAGRGISAPDLGDQFLFQQGFTMIWIGWQWDVREAPGVIKLHAPAARGVTGPVRSEILVDRRSTAESLGDRTMIPYAVAEVASARLTVRDTPWGERREIPASQWRLDAQAGRVEYPAGFEPGRFYEVVYNAKDPAIAGLGLAAVRDTVAYFKTHGVQQAGDVKRALAYGSSQSGRFLRTFLADGFNANEQGHRVFEGLWAHISGGGHGGFNQRFAQPSRMSGQWNGAGNPVDLAPFTPHELAAGAARAGVAPKILLTNGSHEYWGRAASLNHTSPDGKQDREIPADARVYYLAGTQHTSAANTNALRGVVQNPTNPLEWRFFLRATLVAMNAWISDGAAPPLSQAPRMGRGELVAAQALKFPGIPGVAVPKEAYAPRALDFGPGFPGQGIPTVEPPTAGAAYVTLVPQVNDDGNETSGVVLPELRVPLATYTGWNLRDPAAGAPQGLYPLQGSFIPFPKTRAERARSGDPRPSIEERYRDSSEYLRRVEAAARELASQRLLLERDVQLIVARARTRWETLTAPAARE
jgi:hypothetical protein